MRDSGKDEDEETCSQCDLLPTPLALVKHDEHRNVSRQAISVRLCRRGGTAYSRRRTCTLVSIVQDDMRAATLV